MKIKILIKKVISTLLVTAILAGVLSTAVTASATIQNREPFVIDTTPKKIEIMDKNKDSGELEVNGDFELHELNLAFQTLAAKTLAKVLLFNHQKQAPSNIDVLENATVAYKTRTLSVAEAHGMGYTDAVDIEKNSKGEPIVEGSWIEYGQFVTELYYYDTNTEKVFSFTIDKIRRDERETTTIKADGVTYNAKYTKVTYVSENIGEDDINKGSSEYSRFTIGNVVKTYRPEEYMQARTIRGVQKTVIMGSAVNTVIAVEFIETGANSSYGPAENGDYAKIGRFAASTLGLYSSGTSAGNVHDDRAWNAGGQYGGNGCYIDLNGYYVITNAVLAGSTGAYNIDFQIGDPGNWQTIGTSTANAYSGGVYLNLNNLPQLDLAIPKEYSYNNNNDIRYKNATRYVKIDANSGNIAEMILYGYKVGELTDYDKGKNGPSYYMDHNDKDFNNYNPDESTYSKGVLAQKLDTKSDTYDPTGYLQYVAANSVDISNENTAGNAFGANFVYTCDIETMTAMGNGREFVSSYRISDKDGMNRFNYTGGQNDVSMDSLYSTMSGMGIALNPCLQFSTTWFAGASMFTAYDQTRNWCPIKAYVTKKETYNNKWHASDGVALPGVDSNKAVSFARHASFMYNYAARYGTNKNVEKETLSFAKDIVRTEGYGAAAVRKKYDESLETGLGYVEVVENANEQNKNWSGSLGYYSASAYAALCSADFDGHEDSVFIDGDGNGYELVKGNNVNYMYLDGQYIGTLNGWEVTLDSSVTPIEVTTYTDEFLNHYEVLLEDEVYKTYINGEYTGVFEPTVVSYKEETIIDPETGSPKVVQVPSEYDFSTGTLTKTAYIYNNKKTVELFNKKTTLKLYSNGKFVGTFNDNNLTVKKSDNVELGEEYAVYKQYGHYVRSTFTYYVNKASKVAYYNGYAVGSLNAAGTEIILDVSAKSTDGTNNDPYIPVDYPSLVTETAARAVPVSYINDVYMETAKTVADLREKNQAYSVTFTIKPTGVKNADSKMKLSTGGFLESSIMQYLVQMKDWFNYNRTDGYFAVDIINFHSYFTTSSYEDAQNTIGAKNIIDWVEKNAPGRQVWMSEYDTDSMDYALVETVETMTPNGDGTYTYATVSGDYSYLDFQKGEILNDGKDFVKHYYYATDENGQQFRLTLWGGYAEVKAGKPINGEDKYSAPYYSIQSSQNDNEIFQLVKAQRLARASLMLEKLGVNRLSMFELYDTESGVYANSGLTFFVGANTKKLEWYYFSLMRHILSEVNTVDANTKTYNLAVQQENVLDEETLATSPSQTTPLVFRTKQYSDFTKIYKNYYDATVSGSTPIDIYTYKYNNAKATGGSPTKTVYAVWAGTNSQNVIKNYTLDLSACGITDYHVTKTVAGYGYDEGIRSGLEVQNGKVTFDVDEGITYIVVEKNEYDENNDISNYQSLESSMLIPQKIQIGDISNSKPSASHDGTEIVDVNYTADNGNSQKNDFFYKEDLQNAYNAGILAESGLEKALTYKDNALAHYNATVIDAAFNEAMADSTNISQMNDAISLYQTAIDTAKNGLGGYKGWEKAAAKVLSDQMEILVEQLQEFVKNYDGMSAIQRKQAMSEVVQKIIGTDSGFAIVKDKKVTKVLTVSINADTAIRKTPIVNVMILEHYTSKIKQTVEELNTDISLAKEILSNRDKEGALGAANELKGKIKNLSDLLLKTRSAMTIANTRTGSTVTEINNSHTNTSKIAGNMQVAIDKAWGINLSDSTKKLSSQATNLYSYLTTPNSLVNIQQQLEQALSTLSIAETIGASNEDKIVMLSMWATFAYSYSGYNAANMVVSLSQLSTGIFYDGNENKLYGESKGRVIVEDKLLSQFAKMIDEEVSSYPAYKGDILNWYDRNASFGTTFYQVPQSITGLLPAYSSEYVVGGVLEGYDLYMTFDDYYHIDEAMLYHVEGVTHIEVYDASEGGSGELLLKYESGGQSSASWRRLLSVDNALPAKSFGNFTEAALTTPTNKVRVVWKAQTSKEGELVLYGKKAISKAGYTVTPVPGELDSNRTKNISVVLNTMRSDVTAQNITGISIPNGATSTTLNAVGKTLPVLSSVNVTDPATGMIKIFAFDGWYTSTGYTQRFTADTLISATTTVYAKWTEVSAFEQIVLTTPMISTTDTSYKKNDLYKTINTQAKISYSGSDFTTGSFSAPSPILIDLGEIYILDQITMVGGTGTGFIADIEISLDGINFTNIASGLATGYASQKSVYLNSAISGDTYAGRYIRFTGTGNLVEILTFGNEINESDYEKIKFKYTFVSNVEGIEIEDVLYNYKSTNISLPTPQREGYVFFDWYTDAALTTAYNKTTEVIADTTLYAKWKLDQNFSITYMSEGEIYEVVDGYTSEDTVTTIMPYSPSGRTFIGWYLDAACNRAFTATTISANTILYAKWSSSTDSSTIPYSVAKTYGNLSANHGLFTTAAVSGEGWVGYDDNQIPLTQGMIRSSNATAGISNITNTQDLRYYYVNIHNGSKGSYVNGDLKMLADRGLTLNNAKAYYVTGGSEGSYTFNSLNAGYNWYTGSQFADFAILSQIEIDLSQGYDLTQLALSTSNSGDVKYIWVAYANEVDNEGNPIYSQSVMIGSLAKGDLTGQMFSINQSARYVKVNISSAADSIKDSITSVREAYVYGTREGSGDTAILTATAQNGTITGNKGSYNSGELATLTAEPQSADYIFSGWFMDGVLVSNDLSFSTIIYKDTTLSAVFVHKDAPLFSYTVVALKAGETITPEIMGTEVAKSAARTWSIVGLSSAVTVTQKGHIRAKEAGTAEVRVTTQYGFATLMVTVVVEGNTIGINIAGAQIKVTSSANQSLRFGTYTTNRDMDLSYTNVQYGMILLPTSILGSNGTLADDFFIGEAKAINVIAQVKGISGTGYIYNIVLNGFSPSNLMRYDTEITARSYVKYTDSDGIEKTIYSNVLARSVYNVAQNYCNGTQAEGRTDWTEEEALAYIIKKSEL